METSFLEYKIKHIENELQEVKSMLSNFNKNKKKLGFSSLCGILKGKTNLSLKEIQSFKYKAKEF
jgi:hypothetical protein